MTTQAEIDAAHAEYKARLTALAASLRALETAAACEAVRLERMAAEGASDSRQSRLVSYRRIPCAPIVCDVKWEMESISTCEEECAEAWDAWQAAIEASE